MLLEYCNHVGITNCFQDLLMTRNELQPDSNKMEEFGNFKWTVQHPEENGFWNNDMHSLYLADENVYQEFLKVLSDAGFDAASVRHDGIDVIWSKEAQNLSALIPYQHLQGIYWMISSCGL
jgi:ankyrin repeat protein